MMDYFDQLIEQVPVKDFPEEFLRTVVHESGHASCGLYFGWGINKIVVEKVPGTDVYGEGWGGRCRTDIDLHLGSLAAKDPKNDVLLYLMGTTAEDVIYSDLGNGYAIADDSVQEDFLKWEATGRNGLPPNSFYDISDKTKVYGDIRNHKDYFIKLTGETDEDQIFWHLMDDALDLFQKRLLKPTLRLTKHILKHYEARDGDIVFAPWGEIRQADTTLYKRLRGSI